MTEKTKDDQGETFETDLGFTLTVPSLFALIPQHNVVIPDLTHNNFFVIVAC